jgi:PKHD-type hydroxylase
MANNLGYYHIPSGLPKEICEIIQQKYLNSNFEQSFITQLNGNNIDEKYRKSKQLWLETDSWVAGMMAHFVHCANTNHFKFDIKKWSDKIQYTVYDEIGSHYKWHCDTQASIYDPQYTRKLSISLLLSSKEDFKGGELQIMASNNEMVTVDMNVGDAIVFPSDAMHRVRPLKEGKRVSLVGWFAGPPLR